MVKAGSTSVKSARQPASSNQDEQTRPPTGKAGSRAKSQKSEEKEAQQKLRIKISAYDHKVIDASCKQIIDAVLRQGCELIGPVPLPTAIRKYTVNRSPFVHKDAREQFEMRTHKRLIDILNPTPKMIDALTSLNLPAGVDIEIKM